MNRKAHFVLLFAFFAIFLSFIVFVLFSHFQGKAPSLTVTPGESMALPTVTEPLTVPTATTAFVDIDNSIPTQGTELQNGVTYAPTEQVLRPIGRTVLQNGVRWFSISGCGAEFQTGGDAVILTLLVADSDYVVSHHRPRIGVFVNGVMTNDLILEKESTDVYVPLSADAPCTVKLIKLSESMYSCVGLAAITCVGSAAPTPTGEKLRIEFIGDSITAGFGLDEPNVNADFSTRTENFSETYAYLCASALNADCWGVAYSGYGVVSGFSSSGALNAGATLDPYYEKALTNCRAVDDSGAVWAFTQNAPQYIVINLGTNDANNYCCTEARCQEFVLKYQELLALVRSRNPGAFILCVLGDMNDKLYPYIEQAVQSYCAATLDSGVSCMALSFAMDVYPATIAGHPSKDSNFYAAQILTEALWRRMTGQ